MYMQLVRLTVFVCMSSALLFALYGAARADPPSRVARLAYVSGEVSFSPAGVDDWDQAKLNRPLTRGDRLWTEARARTEIQVGGAMIRMHANTGLSVLNLDEWMTQLKLTQGRLNISLRHIDPDQEFEVDTPNLAFVLRQPGEYRIDVDADGNTTRIVMRAGQGEAYGETVSYVIDAPQAYLFGSADMPEYAPEYARVAPPRRDEFDRWASERDDRYAVSVSARYVSPDVIGYQDLDANGTWRVVESYGNVWFPRRVSADWAPYRNGHWTWIDPWGWTWVDDAAWGFAVSHYGRWANLHGVWAWVPGPARARAYYAPALVAFVGGDNFSLTFSSGDVSGVAWFPLGPHEVYRPAYSVSRGYFERLNLSNAVIAPRVIEQHYSNRNETQDVYANRHVRGAVVAVPINVFKQSRPVSSAAVQISREMRGKGSATFAPPVAPSEISVRGGAIRGGKPPQTVFQRRVIARTAPPAPPLGFAEQRRHLSEQPGKPLDDAVRKQLRPAEVAPKPVIKLVKPRQEMRRDKQAQPLAAEVKPVDAHGKSAPREKRDSGDRPATSLRLEPPRTDRSNAGANEPHSNRNERDPRRNEAERHR